jgi:hypothetical protein
MTLAMKRPEISDLFVTKDGLKEESSEEFLNIISRNNFLRKELGEIAELLDLNVEDYLSNFVPLFFRYSNNDSDKNSNKGKSLYVIGADSYDTLLAQGIDIAQAKNYGELRSLDTTLTKKFQGFRDTYTERNCGNLVFIHATGENECYFKRSGKRIKQ